jgi:hypothetical protein
LLLTITNKTSNDIKDLMGKAIDWVKENWPLLLGVLTGPFGLFIAFLVKYKEEIGAKVAEVWAFVTNITEILWTKLTNLTTDVWVAISDFILNAVKLIRDGIVNKWNTIVADVQAVFDALKKSVKVIWDNIVTGAGDFVTAVIEKFKDVFGLMIQVGKDIANGVWQGLSSMKNFIKNKFDQFFGDLLPGWAKLALKIASPSKVFFEVGQNIVKGLANGITSGVNVTAPKMLSSSGSSMGSAVNITINAGVGTDPYALGRTVQQALNKYNTISK